MATYQVVREDKQTKNQPRYITLRVMFADQVFEQQIISALSGDDLTDFLQLYADDYERDWLVLNPPPPPIDAVATATRPE